MEKRICALTMVRNDDFYLRRWVDYYGKELGRENLYVWFDGTDQMIPDFCDGVHTEAVEKLGGQVVEAEKKRLDFLSVKASELLKSYDIVIGTDADEFLIVEPDLNMSLSEYLSNADIRTSLSGLGVDVGQHTAEEGDIRDDGTFLGQRHYARLSTRYTKPCVINEPVRWGRGFHRVKGHNFHIGKGLYLFHFGYFDIGRIKARFEDPSRREAGWTKHLEKRSKTIRLVTERPARDWDTWTRRARLIQTVFRPPYAWNKPAMFEMAVIVRIPERFEKLV
ncbi:MAG: glycosyltransferase family 2 protein [Candidatus Cryptobacteroides sp.]